MNMPYWSPYLAYCFVQCSLIWCLEFTSSDSSAPLYSGNASENICFSDEHEISYPRRQNKITSPKETELNVIEVMKHRFINMADAREKQLVSHKWDYRDDPNRKQALMSRAFIDNANYVFNKNEVKDMEINDAADFVIGKPSGYQVLKYPKVKLEFDKTLRSISRNKRDASVPRDSDEGEDIGENTNEDNFDENDEKRKKLRESDEPEMRVHCVRAGPSEVVCKHENFTFTFKLPPELFKKKIMENLVSSVCSIVEEAAPDGAGKLEVSVTKGNAVKKEKDRNEIVTKLDQLSKVKEGKEPPKVIRINIPIDFSAIPLNFEDDDEKQKDKIDKQHPSGDLRSLDQDMNSIEKTKYQPFKARDNYLAPQKQINDEPLALIQTNEYNYDNTGEENQEKWLTKRDSFKNPMVFPPSLILLKRSPQDQIKNEYEENKIDLFKRKSHLPNCRREKFRELLSGLTHNHSCSGVKSKNITLSNFSHN